MTKKIGKPFAKGKSGNPGGRPALPQDVREIRLLNQVGFIRMVNRFGHMTPDEFKTAFALPGMTLFDRMVGNLVKDGATGERDAAKLILDRLIGKVQDQVLGNEEQRRLAEMPDSELLALGRAAIKVLELERV